MAKLKKALSVFVSFFKIGLFTFGGGYAMLSVISNELVEKKKWISQEDLTDMLIIAEMTPGAISVNSSTFVGFRVAGVLGGVLGTLGVVLPSLIIITVLSYFVHYLDEVAWLWAAFKGIQAVVVVLIANAMVKFFKQLDKDWKMYLIAAVALLVTLLTNFDVIFLILAGGVYGVIYSLTVDVNKKKLLNTAIEDKIELLDDRLENFEIFEKHESKEKATDGCEISDESGLTERAPEPSEKQTEALNQEEKK